MPPRIDFTAYRLFIDQPMQAGTEIALDRGQSNYLLNVLRMREGSTLLVFNGRDGEWRAVVTGAGRKAAVVRVGEQTREQPRPSNIWLCFAPIRSARQDYLVQKAVEMGVSRLIPVDTSRTQIELKNPERLRANVVEAAEQCGVLAIPEISAVVPLPQLPGLLAGAARALIFCDEMVEVANPIEALAALARHAPVAVLVGPEGGFSEDERVMIAGWAGTIRIALGPRILRAETAAVAALVAVQLAVGDWN